VERVVGWGMEEVQERPDPMPFSAMYNYAVEPSYFFPPDSMVNLW
jgi:hypothetical protein